MRPCESFREALIDLQYGALDAGRERECRRHLAECAGCAAEQDLLKSLFSSLAPQQGDSLGRENDMDWNRFAQVTVARALNAAPARERHQGWVARVLPGLRLPSFSMTPAWAAAAAGLVLVAGLGMLTYYYLPGAPPAPGALVARSERNDVVMPQANIDNLTVNLARQNTAEYLRQTRAVLVSMMDVNIHCEKGKVDISAERAKASELLRRQRLIAEQLNSMPLARAQDVCNDLEKLLLEVASLADCARDDDIRTIRDVVEKRQILVRMELLGQELSKREGSNV